MLNAVMTLSILLPSSLTTKWSVPLSSWVAPLLLKCAPTHDPPEYSAKGSSPVPVLGSKWVTFNTMVTLGTTIGGEAPGGTVFTTAT
jgi:hypothetical protein